MPRRGVSFSIPDRYEFLDERVVGGQGYVSKYRDKFLDRDVAMKEMRYPVDATSLRDELARIRDIRSRHVVEIYDLLEARRSNSVALVEEYVPGQTVQDLALSTPAISESTAIRTLWQIADGIADIHAQNIIHRDIKPQNMKLDSEGVVKILDFGLSSVLEPDAETRAARGTRHYRSPEMYETPPIALNEAIDVYAFGVTCWHVLNKGRLPNPLREVPPQSSGPCPSLQRASIVLPRRLTDLLDATLSCDASQRPAMAMVRDSLRSQIISGQHRLVFGYAGQQREISTTRPRATLSAGSSSLIIAYDQFQFFVEAAQGDVYLNNTRAVIGSVLPDSFVVTFGSSAEGPARNFIPMNILAPEVVL